MVNYFKVLEISYDADEKTVKSAFRRKVKLLHPDTGVYDEKKFSLIMEAYSVLSKKEQRNEYYNKLIDDLVRKKVKARKAEGPVSIKQSRLLFPNRLDSILKRIKVFDKKRYSEVSGERKEDVIILITADERKRGIQFVMNLPIRKVCPACFGNADNCYLCEGSGLTTASFPFKVVIQGPIEDDFYIVNINHKPLPMAYFLIKKIRVKLATKKN